MQIEPPVEKKAKATKGEWIISEFNNSEKINPKKNDSAIIYRNEIKISKTKDLVFNLMKENIPRIEDRKNKIIPIDQITILFSKDLNNQQNKVESNAINTKHIPAYKSDPFNTLCCFKFKFFCGLKNWVSLSNISSVFNYTNNKFANILKKDNIAYFLYSIKKA